MGNTAYILTKEDVPQYIQEIVKRLHIVMIDYIDDKEQNWWGYTFKLKAKWKLSYEHQLEADCEKLLKWCKRWNAHAELIKYMWWNKEVPCQGYEYTKTHYRKAMRKGFHNHALLVISDPVAHRFEKDNFYR